MTDQNSQFMAILTAVGEAKQANANALGIPWVITQMGVGDANGTDPDPDRLQTSLINERRRAPLNRLDIDPNNDAIIIAEQVLPENVGGWWIREIGLYDEDNDLVAVANCPPTFKPELSQGSGRTQVVRLNILVSSTEYIQLKIDPSVVLATRAYADSLIVNHKAETDPHPQYQLRGAITSLSANTQLNADHEGLILLSAASGTRTYTLPAATSSLGVRELVLRRTDASSNALVIAASGTDKLRLDTTVQASGQSTTELLFSGDWLRLRSDGAGNWWCVGQAELPASITGGVAVFDTAGNHTFSVPAVLRSGRRYARVTVIGAGGGGGRNNSFAGGGGGGGGRSSGIVNLSSVVSVSVTVGSGGAGRADSTGLGTPGGTSSFGSYISATGGSGGGVLSGGDPGVGNGGNLNLAGGPGGQSSSGTSGAFTGGLGGSGRGALSESSSTAGRSGVTHGAGGGGGILEANGGNGFRGIVVVEW
ncbi:phage tail protein [Halopseudomonas phragmitis]|uniref:Phage tail protein n=1 Tax=Halopseudomonas phragmitis TaxID=1931241 RepID=A0A1V0B6A3_9GAMM|nr:phage tail protein [Halopseudomonas phragmitis]AQZ95458.1 hypothetical protein BVH74_12170 [Halopseudomonas phragmitis]